MSIAKKPFTKRTKKTIRLHLKLKIPNIKPKPLIRLPESLKQKTARRAKPYLLPLRRIQIIGEKINVIDRYIPKREASSIIERGAKNEG